MQTRKPGIWKPSIGSSEVRDTSYIPRSLLHLRNLTRQTFLKSVTVPASWFEDWIREQSTLLKSHSRPQWLSPQIKDYNTIYMQRIPTNVIFTHFAGFSQHPDKQTDRQEKIKFDKSTIVPSTKWEIIQKLKIKNHEPCLGSLPMRAWNPRKRRETAVFKIRLDWTVNGLCSFEPRII